MLDYLRRNVRWIGAALSLLALAAFVHAFVGILTVREAGAMLAEHWSALLWALLLYCVAYVPMSLAWLMLARNCGARIGNAPLLRIFLVSQIGKYLPGNVGHLLGRAYLAHNRGIALDVTGVAMSLEMIGVLAAGALFATLSGILSPRAGEYSAVPLVAGALAFVMLAALLFLSRRRISNMRGLARSMFWALVCYLAVFTLLAAAHVALLGAGTWPLALKVGGAVVLSWLVGFMVPGAPAGLGLREMSLYALLTDVYPQEAVLFAAAGMRLATTAGDGVAWLIGLGLGRDAEPVSPLPPKAA